MNDGIRRSLLIARLAKLQVEDAAELASDVTIAWNLSARPGWGTAGAPVGEWVGEQPSMVTGAMVDRALQRVRAVVDGQLQRDTSKA